MALLVSAEFKAPKDGNAFWAVGVTF